MIIMKTIIINVVIYKYNINDNNNVIYNNNFL